MPTPDQMSAPQARGFLRGFFDHTMHATQADIQALRADIAELRKLLTGGESSVIITGQAVKDFMRKRGG